MAFDLDSYEPVAARLARFLTDHPDARVITDLVHYLADTAVFKAELWLGDTLIATGWAEEIRGQGNVNKTSHLENCESSAVGRALANAGYAGSDPSKRPSREEMAKVNRQAPANASNGPREIVNKLKGKCGLCGGVVDVGQGIARNEGDGWKTFHNQGQCPTEEPF